MKKLFIGIDPDTNKSGVAAWDGKELKLYNLTFFELYDFLKDIAMLNPIGVSNSGIPIMPYDDAPVLKVIIEAGWLNEKANWHYLGSYTTKNNAPINNRISYAAKSGANVGANWETGKKIAEMCEYLGIEYELKRPQSSKVDAKYFEKLTGYKGRTNAETRDAAMLVFGM